MNRCSLNATGLAVAVLLAGPTTGAAQDSKDCALVLMHELLPYMVSSGTDNDVNEAIAGMVGDYYGAIGDGASDAGDAASGSKAGLLLKAAGVGAKGLSAVAGRLSAVISSVDSARDDADDLYMSLSTERGHEASFFPALAEYTDRFSPGVPAQLQGVKGRVVPYVFGVDPTRDSISVTLFDHDASSRDDILGNFIFNKADAGKGKLATMSISEKHGGVVYVVQYEVVPVTCVPAADIVLKPLYQSMGFSSLENAIPTTAATVGMLPFYKDDLAAAGAPGY